MSAKLMQKIVSEKDARIAELTAEVARLQEALTEITRGLNADARSQVIARSALKECK